MEIERKYRVNNELWASLSNPSNAHFIQQAYLSTDPSCTVRLRIRESHAFLTIKGKREGISRPEFEYPIPMAEGIAIMKLALTPVVIKYRYKIVYKGFTWEVDEFLGDNEGLIIAEVELKKISQQPEYPEWVLSEVSDDPRYSNLNLALNPFKSWNV